MCGICGLASDLQGKQVVRQMARAMVHRGPDGEGYLDCGSLHLGMRRLKIIDLDTGDQPIYNEDQSAAVILNGEIYNYRQLRSELSTLGHHFATQSDTEVIIHAYEQWGSECASHLRGMFAFAVFDGRHDQTGASEGWRLFLARDRLGIKPLYYWMDEDRLLFASEVRALLASGKVPKQLSPAGLYSYLAFGSLQEPLTIIQGIRTLPSASWMLVEQDGERIKSHLERYWHPAVNESTDPDLDQVLDWLTDSVGSHLVSDVPVGAFLSGGLDSGCIVALGSQATQKPMCTFTLAFDGWQDDEREAATNTARMWGSEHNLHTITAQDVLSDIDLVMASMDQPTVDGVNSWYVSREAKRAGLTVSLSGVGGDELFAGYPSFRDIPWLKRLPAPLPGAASLGDWIAGWQALPGSADSRRKLASYLGGEYKPDHPYFAYRGLFTPGQISSLLKASILEEVGGNSHSLDEWLEYTAEQVGFAAHLDRAAEVSWLELTQYMKSTLLRDTDMMSMAHSLEVRVPFVDHHLIENILPVGWRRKIANGRTKPLLATALDQLLPNKVLSSPKKTFTFPFEAWLRQGLADRIGDHLQIGVESLAEWSNLLAVRHVWEEYAAKRTNWSRPWSLYILDEWIKRYLR
jgi:asparagine synthase (glutamine-hydrolysing)